ncbi:D-2-hydroxyacid dehydrogenase family protein [Paracoccus sp. TK19116]|uniref:D-2-hydroxyacid dehydrogenase family protein n=1 Tax=Paracoccus albicereus TaxID=2922394 RepID=A0ABT1MSM9_9RHOB|nr:D-2-hydroxyacid dehydrogenase family protein [Paracoccus albicereus]MCQ0970353.1 D-2-hydroxyacid dehydrogenase family protein [Paracoccus albicereus]
MKVHILDDWHDTLRHLPSYAKLADHDVTIWTDHVEDPAVLADRLGEAEAVVLFRERTAITDELLARLPNLRLISQRGVHPHVDVEACTRHGVTLSSNKTATGPSVAAAELTFALILSAARQLPQQMASLKEGKWQLAPGQSLHGRRIGLYGFGRLGRQVATYARAFGMKIWWWGSEGGRARAADQGEEVAPSREAFFTESDVISVHVRMVPETRGLITEADLTSMKPSAIFVNTSRAGLIAPGATLAAAEAGRPGMIALDVFDREPLTDPHDPILIHPRIIATPHIGFVTEDELDRQFADIYNQIDAFAEGTPIHVVNPEAATGS